MYLLFLPAEEPHFFDPQGNQDMSSYANFPVAEGARGGLFGRYRGRLR